LPQYLHARLRDPNNPWYCKTYALDLPYILNNDLPVSQVEEKQEILDMFVQVSTAFKSMDELVTSKLEAFQTTSLKSS